ncbi:hypothetical protein D3C72_1702480 [compost metagenome]
MQIQRGPQAELVAVACSLVIVEAAIEVCANFTNVVDFDVDALLQQFGTGTAPVAGHPLRLRGKGIGSLRPAVDPEGRQQTQRKQWLDAF